jgi:hypothetical protein
LASAISSAQGRRSIPFWPGWGNDASGPEFWRIQPRLTMHLVPTRSGIKTWPPGRKGAESRFRPCSSLFFIPNSSFFILHFLCRLRT